MHALPARAGQFLARPVLGAALCASACGSPAKERVGPSAALPVLERAFGSAPAAERLALFAPAAAAAWQAVETDATVRFGGVSDLRWVSETQRAALVDFERERWPLAVAVTLTAEPTGGTDAGWRIAEIDRSGALRRHLEALGPHGLPRAGAARPWTGGLAGRDAAGRPNAAILVLATEAGLEVDGGPPLPAEPAAIVSSLKAAVARREALAADAHATARIQAAFGLARESPGGVLPKLCAWAREAGIREQLLLVRGPDGGPGVLALPALDPVSNVPGPPPGPACAPAAGSAPPSGSPTGPIPPSTAGSTPPSAAGSAPPSGPPRTCDPAWAPYLWLFSTPAGYALEAAGEAVVLGDLVDASVPEHLGPAIEKLRRAHPGLVGLRVRMGPGVSHGQLVGFLDGARLAAPDLPVLPEFEETAP